MRQLFIVIILLLARAVFAQEQPHYLMPIAGDGQRFEGSAAINDGFIGLAARKTDAGFKIFIVAPGSPAQKSGIQVDDVITSVDEQLAATLGQHEFANLLNKKSGQIIQVSYVRNGQQMRATVTVESRASVFPAESKMPPGVIQTLFDGHAAVGVTLSQASSWPQSVMLTLVFTNGDSPFVTVDDSKFFVLDGQGQQLQHMSLEEMKYSTKTWLAQNLHDANYPPPTPPPPQHHYVITGSSDGNYTFTEMGNMGTLSGTSSSTYTVQEQPDYNQAGYMLGYSLALAIRQHADRRHNDQVFQQAQKSLEQWDGMYFKSQSPVIPGENRTGGILYLTGSARLAVGPFKIVLFFTNPANGKEEIARFEFH